MSASVANSQTFGPASVRAELTGANNLRDVALRENIATTQPERLGPWVLESLLKEGALTRIYRARPQQAASGLQPAQYSMKVLRQEWCDDPLAVARIRQEAMVGRCVAHRHVAQVLSVHVHRPPYYVVLPWLPGTNVGEFLAARGRMDVPLALWIARQAAQALEALHTAGYLHGDVKPGNLLFNADGHVTLIDLSCARRLEEDAEAESSIIEDRPLLGTPKYAAPEIFFGKRAAARSDLYSLGLTLYEMLAGRILSVPAVMADLTAFKRNGAIPNVRTYAPHTPQKVVEFLRCLIARDPLRRPSTAREMVNRLMRLEIATLCQRVPA